MSETTFPVQTGEHAYRMRIFSPTAELQFAGHPSLGTAWLMGPGRWTQTTPGGTVTVEADERGSMMTQPRPEFARVEDEADTVLSALGLASADAICRSTAAGMTHILVATSQPIDELDPDSGRVAQASSSCDGFTLTPFRAINESKLQARVFAPAVGVVEDPGSGSAAGPIALLANQIWGTHSNVTINMGAEVGRPCQLEVQTTNDIRVGGRVVLSAEGHFLL